MLKGRLLQYAATLSVSLMIACSFLALQWPASILPLLLSEKTPLRRPITLMEAALINFLLMIGAIVGNFFVGILINNFGRRGTLLIGSVPGFISWVMILFGQSVEIVLIARFIMGVALSAPTAVSMMYIGETVETQIRGKLIVICFIAAEIGAILATVLGPISYRTVALVAACIPLLFFLTFYFMPETPYYYLRKEKYISAEKVLVKLRGTEDVKEELTDMSNAVKKSMQNKGTIGDLLRISKCRRAFLIVLGLKTIADLSGGTAIQSNLNLIFQIANTGLDPNTSALICVVVPFPFMLVASYMIDRFGRKPLLYVSTLGTASALLMEAVYFYMQDSGGDVSSISWLPITGIFLSIIFKACGIGSIPHLIMGEIFPENVKALGTSIALIYAGTLGAIVVLLFPLVSAAFGLGTSFLIFSMCCVLGFVFSFYFVIETKGKSLAEIQESL